MDLLVTRGARGQPAVRVRSDRSLGLTCELDGLGVTGVVGEGSAGVVAEPALLPRHHLQSVQDGPHPALKPPHLHPVPAPADGGGRAGVHQAGEAAHHQAVGQVGEEGEMYTGTVWPEII